MKDELCEAFCGELVVREVPAGLAVSTAFDGINGDPIGFYVIGPDESGNYRIEDNGVSVSFIEASGADLSNKTRHEAFLEILREYGADYDEDSGELVLSQLDKNSLPTAAIRFVALLLRIQDIILMAAERAASTFREDVLRALKKEIGEKAKIEENIAVSAKLADFVSDVVIRAEGHAPVAVFLGVSDQKVSEAMLLQLEATYVKHEPCSVVALIEKDGAISRKTFNRAVNRLAAVTVFRGDEEQAINRIREEALGRAFH
jgi:hypothetical protein